MRSIDDLICYGKLGILTVTFTSMEAIISDRFWSRDEYKAILSCDYSVRIALIQVVISLIWSKFDPKVSRLISILLFSQIETIVNDIFEINRER